MVRLTTTTLTTDRSMLMLKFIVAAFDCSNLEKCFCKCKETLQIGGFVFCGRWLKPNGND
jgi:hypothetical protein